MLNLTDEQLFERFSFDVAFRRAMGIEDFSEYAMAEKTLYNIRAALWEYEHEHGENIMEPVFRLLRDDLIYPAGKKSRSTSVSGNTSVANFDPAHCARCKKQHICPAVVSSTQSQYVIDAHRRWLDERYTLMKTDEYQKLCKPRPPVEGLMTQLKGKYLKGRTVFRGRIKVKNRMILRAIGINFRKYWAY